MFGGKITKIPIVAGYYNNEVWYPSVSNGENTYFYGWYFNQPNGSGHLLTCGLI